MGLGLSKSIYKDYIPKNCVVKKPPKSFGKFVRNAVIREDNVEVTMAIYYNGVFIVNERIIKQAAK